MADVGAVTDHDWRAAFNEAFQAPESAVAARIFREALADEYPEELVPHSYVTWSLLRRIVAEVRVGPGSLLADIGCGRGGPGLWVAARTGARLLGLDIADNAVAAARVHAEALSVDAEFRRGTFEETGLPDGSVDAVMSVDALLFTPSKPAAAAELRRILRPGGRLVFTSWDYDRQPVGRPPQVADHRPLLDAAGFDVVAYDVVRGWRAMLRRVADATLAALDEIAMEDGVPVEDVRADIEEEVATVACMKARVLVVAEARG